MSKLREIIRKVIKEEKYGADNYSKNIQDIWSKESAAWNKMKGTDFDELVSFFNKEKNTNISKQWFAGSDFIEFPPESKSTISKFLKMKKYL